MVDDSNIMLTSLIIICNYIRYAIGNCAILPEEAVHNLVTGYMEAEYKHSNMKMIRMWKRAH